MRVDYESDCDECAKRTEDAMHYKGTTLCPDCYNEKLKTQVPETATKHNEGKAPWGLLLKDFKKELETN